jgi:outer membrane receptor protein involved in Fe transport
MLEEVIVTAEKRATSIQDTPIAVSAFSQDDLDAQLINDQMNLQFNVPSLVMTKGNFTSADVRIRGVGSGAIGSAGDAGVGIHMNGAYLWSSRMFEGQYFDSERVEVLRGPQGTLYGRNTTGGAINVITNKADPSAMSGNIELTAGNYNATQMRGYINMPITDNLAVRFAGMQLQRDGFITNQFTGNDIDDRDMWGGRLSVNWTPTDSTEVNLTIHHFDEEDSRARSQKSACKKDPSGILGCLPGYNDVYESPHSASGISGTLTGQIGQVASGVYGVYGALAGLQAQGLADAAAQAAAAGDLATAQALGDQAAAAMAQMNSLNGMAAQALFPADDYAVDGNPDGMRSVNMDYEPTYAADETIVTLDIKQDLGDMTLTILGGYSKSFVDSTEDYEKAVASETWAPQLQALAGLANLTAIDAATSALVAQLNPAAAAVLPFMTELYPGAGYSLWAGAKGQPGNLAAGLPSVPDMRNLAGGINTLLPNGGYERYTKNWGADRSFSQAEEFTAEVRLISDFDGDFNFQLGAFYMDVENQNGYIVRSSGLALIGEIFPVYIPQFPAPLGNPDNPFDRLNPYMQGYHNDARSYEVSTWAVFGEAYYQVTDKLKATLGLRYSDEEKDGVQRTLYVTFLDGPGSPKDAAGDGDFYYPTYEDSQTSWKVNLTYDYSDDIMFYGTASSSFKSGGFNPISIDSPLVQADPRNAVFEPEFIDAFEVGMKATLLDGAMRLNGTYFFYDYQDLQVSRIVGVTSLNGNTDSEISGLELELTWALSEKWILSAQASFIESEILDYQVYDTTDPNAKGTTEGLVSVLGNNYLVGIAPEDCEAGAITSGAAAGLCPGIPKDQSGNSLANTPETSINIGLSYLTELGGHPLTLSTNYYWQDDMYSRNENEKKDISPSWEVWNASARYEDSDGKWYADVWVKNILDDDYITGMYSTAQVSSLFTNQFLLDPRTYGLTVGYRF